MIQRTLGATALLLVATSLPAQDDAQVVAGGKLTHVELGPMYNGDGRTKLAEFVGQPVLFEFWGTR